MHPQHHAGTLRAVEDLEGVRHLGDERQADPHPGAVESRNHAATIVGDLDEENRVAHARADLDVAGSVRIDVGVHHDVVHASETASATAERTVSGAPSRRANRVSTARANATAPGSTTSRTSTASSRAMAAGGAAVTTARYVVPPTAQPFRGLPWLVRAIDTSWTACPWRRS